MRDVRALETPPRLLLHSCCAPCSSYVLECLLDDFGVSVFYYNPNIHPRAEYEKRKAEQLRLIEELHARGRRIGHIDADYDERAFVEISSGHEGEREGGARCAACFGLRLRATAERASANGYDFFATTLTVSPHKNAQMINSIGLALEKELGVRYLPSDFKKKDGYKRSIELSKHFGLYRQTYCGCAYSLPKNASMDVSNEARLGI